MSYDVTSTTLCALIAISALTGGAILLGYGGNKVNHLVGLVSFLLAFGLTGALMWVDHRAENATYDAIENAYGHLDERGNLDDDDSAWVIDGVRYRCDSTAAKRGDLTPVLACVRDTKQPLATS